MTVGEFKQHLYELTEAGQINEDTEIRMAQQPRWAVETHTKSILNELVSWMGDDDFNKFYDYFCSNWEICRSYKELNEKYGE